MTKFTSALNLISLGAAVETGKLKAYDYEGNLLATNEFNFYPGEDFVASYGLYDTSVYVDYFELSMDTYAPESCDIFMRTPYSKEKVDDLSICYWPYRSYNKGFTGKLGVYADIQEIEFTCSTTSVAINKNFEECPEYKPTETWELNVRHYFTQIRPLFEWWLIKQSAKLWGLFITDLFTQGANPCLSTLIDDKLHDGEWLVPHKDGGYWGCPPGAMCAMPYDEPIPEPATG